jgi:hypothetical protein
MCFPTVKNGQGCHCDVQGIDTIIRVVHTCTPLADLAYSEHPTKRLYLALILLPLCNTPTDFAGSAAALNAVPTDFDARMPGCAF